jgi:pyruvate dehydrogenase kinase 2/3/4
MSTIRHYANFPATGVSLRQMVQFGEKPSVGAFTPQPPYLRLPLRAHPHVFHL